MQTPSKAAPRAAAGVPIPLLWLVVASLSAISVLSVAHGTLGIGSGDSNSARARRLLQRGQHAPAAGRLQRGDGRLHVERDPEVERQLQQRLQEQQRLIASGGDSERDEDGMEEGQQEGAGKGKPPSSSGSGGDDGSGSGDGAGSSSSGGSSGSSSDSSSSSDSGGGELLDAVSSSAVERLTAGADLASFSAPGTQCEVTPSHGKVALLFLTHGDLPHDALWRDWMAQAGGLLPRSSLAGPQAFCLKQCDDAGNCERQCGAAAACNPLCLDALQQLGPGRSPSVLARQHLFSLYVHARPTLKDYPEGSLFQGRLIPDRVVAKWATHALAAAAKKLVEAAVLDQANQRFVLVGDTTVPLYHPALMWQQLMREPRSRLDACAHKDEVLMRRRYNPNTMRGERFDPAKHWRKSSQWFSLNRKHAELLAADREVESIFAKHCNVGWDAQLKKHRDCVSDEHYLPSLLAMHGLENETTCDFTGGTYASWEPGTEHPKLFQPGHITPALLAEIRGAPGHSLSQPATEEDKRSCGQWAAATQAAKAAFLNVSAVSHDTCAATLGSPDYLLEDVYAGAALSEHCVLLARKFSAAASKWVHALYRNCSPDLGVLPCDQQLTDRDQEWWR